MFDFNVEGVKPLVLQFKKKEGSNNTVQAFTFANIIINYGDVTDRLQPNDIVMLSNQRMFVVVTSKDCAALVRLFNTSIYDYLKPKHADSMVGYGYTTGKMTARKIEVVTLEQIDEYKKLTPELLNEYLDSTLKSK